MRGVAVVVWCCVKEALSRAAMVRASRGAEAADGGGGAATAPRAPSGSWLELRLPFGADGKLADAFRVFRTDAVCFVPPPQSSNKVAGSCIATARRCRKEYVVGFSPTSQPIRALQFF